MTYKKAQSLRSDILENEYVESILEILDKEMANSSTNSRLQSPSNEMDLLVADLLGYLKIED